MLALTSKQFNALAVDAQVAYVNKALEKLGSLRKVASDLQINKSTIQSRFKRSGYVLRNNHYDSENSELVEKKVQMSGKLSDKFLNKTSDKLETHEELISIALSSIAENFLKIGSQLLYIQDHQLYKKRNYQSLADYALATFNMKKTAVYNLISVYNKFANNGQLMEQYRKFNYSQLVELINASDDVVKKVKTTDTIKEIREKKKNVNKTESKQKKIQGQMSVENFVDVPTSDVRPTVTVDISKYQQPLIDVMYILDDIQKEHKTDVKLLENVIRIKDVLQKAVRQLNNLNK